MIYLSRAVGRPVLDRTGEAIGTVADLSNADFYCRPSCQGQGVKGGEQVITLVKAGAAA